MNKIIGFYGIGRSGKATTLNILIAKIDSQYSSSKVRNVKFSSNINNQIVCIVTCGDTGADIEDACRFFDEKECDIAIVATLSKGKSCKKLVEFAKNRQTRIEWIEKKRDHLNPSSINQDQANELLDLLNSYTQTDTRGCYVN